MGEGGWCENNGVPERGLRLLSCLYARDPGGDFESPAARTTLPGLGFISGWKCAATRLELVG